MSAAKDVSSKTIAVVGGGWAGCAAAVELTRRGHRAVLFESSRTLGGRARCVEHGGMRLGNGQHLLLGSCTDTLRMMQLVGVDLKQAVLRLPFQMRYPPASGGMKFTTKRLPAPFHFLTALWSARGLARDDKIALARFWTAARWMDWQLNTDCTVAELLERFDQTEHLTRLLWRPLCIAALSTPPERASARIFLKFLGDSLGAGRIASDMLIPRVDLTALFPHHAAEYVQRHGGTVATGTAVNAIFSEGIFWHVETAGAADPSGNDNLFDGVVVATESAQAAALLRDLLPDHPIPAFADEVITTCYLQYSPATRLARPLFVLPDNPTQGQWGQFVFDRGYLNRVHAGLLAVVVTASAEAVARGNEALADAVAAQLALQLRLPHLANPVWTRVISERQAAFSCTPGLMRPDNTTALRGLVLAGDYTDGPYPATLEGAVRSGTVAAELVTD